MNGIHDLGGFTCFGPVRREGNEPLFHEEWERRVFAMSIFSLIGNVERIDVIRHAIERMDPLHYLESTYYEHWLAALVMLGAEKGLVDLPVQSNPLLAEQIDELVRAGLPSERETSTSTPKFSISQTVRAMNVSPSGHTRLPRYVRGRTGTVELIHGSHVFPDAVVRGEGDQAQPLYNVRFSAMELWGPNADPKHSLYIDLWEEYLEA